MQGFYISSVSSCSICCCMIIASGTLIGELLPEVCSVAQLTSWLENASPDRASHSALLFPLHDADLLDGEVSILQSLQATSSGTFKVSV